MKAKRFKIKVAVLLVLALMVASISASLVYAGSEMNDGEYAINVSMTGGSGKASIESPTLLIVKGGKFYARITWSSSNYDYMIVDGRKYLNESEKDVNSSFTIPVSVVDEDFTVIADTLAMGTPHEIEYQLHFYSDSVDDKSTLPQNGAKRVLMMAGAIIVVGGIMNHFTNKRRNRDWEG